MTTLAEQIEAAFTRHGPYGFMPLRDMAEHASAVVAAALDAQAAEIATLRKVATEALGIIQDCAEALGNAVGVMALMCVAYGHANGVPWSIDGGIAAADATPVPTEIALIRARLAAAEKVVVKARLARDAYHVQAFLAAIDAYDALVKETPSDA